jgi:hypothetical protein
MFPRNRVAQLYPWALGSLYVTSYDSKVYGGGILTLPNLEGLVPIYIYPPAKGLSRPKSKSKAKVML